MLRINVAVAKSLSSVSFKLEIIKRALNLPVLSTENLKSDVRCLEMKTRVNHKDHSSDFEDRSTAEKGLLNKDFSRVISVLK